MLPENGLYLSIVQINLLLLSIYTTFARLKKR
nr:MAG TPA: hypothetical protein [Crassvirales sp.]